MAAPWVGEHSCDEVALGDLQSGLVPLLVLPLGIDLGARRHETREPLRGRVDQVGYTPGVLEPVGQRLIDPRNVLRGLGLRSHAPATIVSCPSQYGARSSRLRSFPAPDLGSGSVRSSIRFGTL